MVIAFMALFNHVDFVGFVVPATNRLKISEVFEGFSSSAYLYPASVEYLKFIDAFQVTMHGQAGLG